MQFLGAMIARDGIEALDQHLVAVKEFPEITNVTQLRQFVGTVNWASMHFPHEYSSALKHLTPYMGKSGVFPLSEKAQVAVKVITDLACRAIKLAQNAEVGRHDLEQMCGHYETASHAYHEYVPLVQSHSQCAAVSE